MNRGTKPRWPGRLGRAGLALVLSGTCGCSHLPFTQPKGPANIAAEGQPPLTMPELQTQVLRYADNYVASVGNSADRVAERIGTDEARLQALKWKVEQGTAAFVNATGLNPVWAALDMLLLAAASHMVIENARSRDIFGGDLEPLLETHRELEATAWMLVNQFLDPGEQAGVRDLIAEWRKQNPNERGVEALHFRELALFLGKGNEPAKRGTTSLFTVLRLNPFSGLDPATVAIEQSRELAARTVAFAERMPTLMRWQAELLTFQVARQPAPQQALGDVGRVSRSLENISKTAEGLPALVDTQRKEALDQLFAGVTAQREAVLADLNAHEATARDLLGQARLTLEAGTAMSNSLDTTIKALDAFLHFVNPPEAKNAPAPSQPSKPFNVLDYGKTAADVGAMAQNLTALLASVDRTAPRLSAVSRQTAEDLKRVVDRAFWRGLVLVVVLLVGSVFAALAYKALARRLLSPADAGSRAGG